RIREESHGASRGKGWIQGDQPARDEDSEARRRVDHLELFLPPLGGGFPGPAGAGGARRKPLCSDRGTTLAGTRPPGTLEHARDTLPQMLHPAGALAEATSSLLRRRRRRPWRT